MASLRDAEVLDVGSNSIERALAEDGKLWIHTTYHDDAALERNKQIRSAKLMEKAKLSLHEDEDVRMVVSCPSVSQWNLFKKQHGETYDLVMSTLEHERMRGARQLQLLHPEWVVQSRM